MPNRRSPSIPTTSLHLAALGVHLGQSTGGPMVTATAPIYVSTDGGNTWTMALIVPSRVGSTFPTGDITLSFSSTPSGGCRTLHKLALRRDTQVYGRPGRPMTALRSQDPFCGTLMTVLDTRRAMLTSRTPSSQTAGGQDKLYIGFNNGFGNVPCPPPVAPSGRSSTLDVSQDAAVGDTRLDARLRSKRATLPARTDSPR